MATALAPEAARTSPVQIPNDVQGVNFVAFDQPRTPVLDPESPSADAPPPNPPFSFPMRLDPPASAPATFSRSTNRRPLSVADIPDRPFTMSTETVGKRRPAALPALPAFSFNPGASLPAEPSPPMHLSPGHPPSSPRLGASAQRPTGPGHRRGGSEFVGGRLREGNSIAVMSSSPTKSESGFSLQPPRRTHRRGMSSVIPAADLPPLPDFSFKGNSAPNTPSNLEPRIEYPSLAPPALVKDASEPVATPDLPKEAEPDVEAPATDAPASPPAEGAVSTSPEKTKPAARARVGFSDTLEFIPRPLSLVSSDASSTTTMKPDHSVSGSLSSLVSPVSPADRDTSSPLSRSPTREATESRPSTAGAVLEGLHGSDQNAFNLSPKRRNSIPSLMESSEAEAGAPSSPTRSKKWSFLGLDPFYGSGTPARGRPGSSSSVESIPRMVSAGSSSEHGSESQSEGPDEMRSKKHKKKGKKRKVRGWAGSILPRKSKHDSGHGKTATRPPTPPPTVLPPDEDDDEPVMVDAQPMEDAIPTVSVTGTGSPPRGTKTGRSEDASHAMIDLDAALGPFNTPLPHNPEWEAAQKAAGSHGKRRLHSAQGMKGFSGPGMHYHRRAESAPDLPPFELGGSSLHRFGSSSTMADVFEEEEEEGEDDETESRSNQPPSLDSQSQGQSESDGETTPPANLTAPRTASMSSDRTPQPMRRKSSGLSDKDQSAARSVRTERSQTSLQEEVIVEGTPSIIFRTANPFHTDRDSETSMPSPKKSSYTKELGPVDVPTMHLPGTVMPTSPYSMTSSYPSPRSPMSLDAQRISTAPSSVTDETSFRSLLMGEPGPELRMSLDYDIPSLTSSNSTMTRESAFSPNPRHSQPILREPRPASMSSSAFGRRRSSLASLSRLISSSHGERSKLSMEVTLDEPQGRKSSKSKTKSKRLGRMMQFWRPNKDATQA